MSTSIEDHDEKGLGLYVAGMNASGNDKAERVLPNIKPGSVLEMGCGDGVLLEAIAQEHETLGLTHVEGLDYCGRLLYLATQRNYRAEVSFTRTDVLNGRNQLGLPFYDNIVCCSFLHEIYSVMSKQGKQFWLWFGEYVLQRLAPGGRVIIRDGVRPKEELVKVKFLNDEIQERFFKFVDDFTPKVIEFSCDSEGIVTLNAVDLYEFATKYFYTKNWDIELQEGFGWTTLEELKQIERLYKYRIVESYTYTIPWLLEKWQNDFVVHTLNGDKYEIVSTQVTVIEAL